MITPIPLVRPFAENGGFAVKAPIPRSDLQSFRGGVLSFVSEDGKFLGPGDAPHEQIRRQGKGSFSLWGEEIYFSASDNTDCNKNNRNYVLVLIDFSKDSELFLRIAEQTSRNDATLLDLINRNSEFNKSLFLNFFGYYNFYTSIFERHGISFPQNAIELGCGERPYTAFRFLMEGVSRCVVNDVTSIDGKFPNQFVEHLRTLVELTKRGSGQKLDKVIIRDSNGTIGIKGLEIHDRQPFEDIEIDGSFDLVYSVSVLEHVMKPREVVAKMRELLKPGGYACHSVDLRDHGDFSNPLGFLRLTEQEYAPMKTENRMRASDWFELFEEIGFKRIECEFDTYESAQNLEHQYALDRPPTIWVDNAMRAKFSPPFHEKELADLSVVGIRVLYQRPA